MAFDGKGLQRQGGHGVTAASTGIDKAYIEATYVTGDAPAVVEASGYFNSAYERLPKNTVLKCLMTAGGTPVFKTYVVTASASGGVTLAIQKPTVEA